MLPHHVYAVATLEASLVVESEVRLIGAVGRVGVRTSLQLHIQSALASRGIWGSLLKCTVNARSKGTARSGLVLLRVDEPDAERFLRNVGWRAHADASEPEVAQLRVLGAETRLCLLEDTQCLGRVVHGCVEVLTSHAGMDPRRAVSTSPSFLAGRTRVNIALAMQLPLP